MSSSGIAFLAKFSAWACAAAFSDAALARRLAADADDLRALEDIRDGRPSKKTGD